MPIVQTLSPVLSHPPLRLLLVWLTFLSLTTRAITFAGAMASPTSKSASTSPHSVSLIVATRLHLGQSTSPPTDLDEKVAGFYQFCAESCATSSRGGGGTMGVLAVDAGPKIAGYDLVEAVQAACDKAMAAAASSTSTRLHVLPVTPWGKFVPALNALVQFAAASVNPPLSETDSDPSCCRHQILFCSAETACSAQAVQTLQSHLQADTAVVGACLITRREQQQQQVVVMMLIVNR
jgi:hypothetical protein